jgi:peptidoglycan/xylan/chitin deacetylase (PgdA/CDA1 family)
MINLIPWRLRSLYYRAVTQRRIDARSRHGMVSFSFDDFPRSALTVGGEILAAHGVWGTYYVAGGLAGRVEEIGEMFSWADLDACVRAGHEVGAHSFSHMNLTGQSRAALEADLQKNRALLDGYGVRNFSFPFGHADLAACSLLAGHFDCCRGSNPGINLADSDLNYLKAVPIYDAPIERFLDLIAEARRERGWLIFYTHDIGDSPSRFGCRIEGFEQIVAAAQASGAMVAPVRDCLAELQGGAPAWKAVVPELVGEAAQPAVE